MKKNVWKIALFGVIFIMLYGTCSRILFFKSTDIMSKDYRKYGKDKFDIIFIGSSIMKNAIYPMDLWEEYGYSSYNLASGSQSVPSSYYIIKEAIREQHPALIVLDCFYAVYDSAYLSNEHLHYVTDQMSMKEKYELVNELVPPGERMEFFLPITRYHNRWKEIQVEDLMYAEHAQYGAKVNFLSRQPLIKQEYTVTADKKELPDISLQYLKKIIQLCQKNDIQLLLTTMPIDWNEETPVFGSMLEKQAYYNGIEDIADQYHINYLNYDVLEQEVRLDLERDYVDTVHLNAYGAEKMTSYIGAYIRKHYQIPNVREGGGSGYEFMKEDYEEFCRYKAGLHLSSIVQLQEYISCLKQMDGITAIFSVKDIQGFSLSQKIIQEMEELGFKRAGRLLEKCYHSFAGIVSNGVNITENIGTDQEPALYSGTVNGKMIEIESRTLNGGNESVICVDGTNYSMNMRGFNIVVMDQITGEIIDKVNFDTHVEELTCCR